MIDVHVARDLNDDLSWWEECETSLGFSQLINVHQISSVRGDIRNMRLVGFNQGMCEYVSFVDPDDVVLPDAFESLLAALIDNPRACGAYGLSMRIDDQGKERGLIHPYRKYSSSYLKNHPLEIHQLVVIDRKSVV